MGVKFMKKNPPGFLKALGVNKTFIDIVSNGKMAFYALETGAYKITGLGKYSHFSVSGHIHPSVAVALLDAGLIADTSNFSVAKSTIEFSFKKMLKKIGAPYILQVADLPSATKVEPVTEVKAKPDVSGVVKIPLRQATSLYQRVNTTTAQKAYVVVGVSGDLNIAARVDKVSNGISLRVESPSGQISKYHSALSELGFVNHDTYSSIHLSYNEHATAAKIIGAVLLGVGAQFTSPLPDVSKVAELSI